MNGILGPSSAGSGGYLGPGSAIQDSVSEAVTNNTTALVQGEIVRLNGNALVTRSQADAAGNLQGTIGVARQAIAAGARGLATNSGRAVVLLVGGLAPVAGDTIYVSAATAGSGTTVAPAIPLGIGVVKDASNYAAGQTVVADLVVSGDLTAALAAVVFSNAAHTSIRSARAVSQSPVGAAVVGGTNFGSDTTGVTVGLQSNYASILGGDANVVNALSLYSAVVAGRSNVVGDGVVVSTYALVVGGFNNRAVDLACIVLGGTNNVAGGTPQVLGAVAYDGHQTITGGHDNWTNDKCAAVLSGRFNASGGETTVIAGGEQNFLSGDGGAVLSGVENYARGPVNGFRSVVCGGYQNRIRGTALDTVRLSLPVAGTTGPSTAAICGGSGNSITQDAARDATFAAILGGQNNSILNCNGGCVGGGASNQIGGAANTTHITISGGSANIATATFASVGGGTANTASGTASHIGGGNTNVASGLNTAIGGGINNTVAGSTSTIAGGQGGSAPGAFSTVSGGQSNTAGVAAGVADYCVVGGGLSNGATGTVSIVAGGHENTATGSRASILGGFSNNATGQFSVVVGGNNNTASNERAFEGGGQDNIASGQYSSLVGGNANTASGDFSAIPGGESCVAAGNFSFSVGNRAKANHTGAFVLADSTAADQASSATDQFNSRFTGGYRLFVGATLRMEITSAANIALFATGSYGSGTLVLFVGNASANPSANPTAGGILYSTGGAGTWRGSGGTVTTFGPAGPHCAKCGKDEWTVATLNTVWKTWRFVCGGCGEIYAGGPTDVRSMLSEDHEHEYLKQGMSFKEIAKATGVILSNA